MGNFDIRNKEFKKIIVKYFDTTFFKGLIAILFYYFTFNIVNKSLTILIASMTNGATYDSPNYYYLNGSLNLIIYLILAIGLVLIYYKTIKNDYKRVKNTHKAFYFVLYAIFYMFIIQIFSNAIYLKLIQGVAINQSENQSAINSITSLPLGFLLMAPATVILAPIVEELIFRRSFFNVFKNKWVALIISSTIFGLMHVTTTYTYLRAYYPQLQSFGYMLAFGIPYFVSGFIFGFTYIKSNKNILAPIALHMLNNYIATIASIIIILI